MTVSQHDARVRRRRVVIADDESIIRLDLGEMLANLGYEVVGEGSDGAIPSIPGILTGRSRSSWPIACARTW
jgi:hypothetical protein